MSHSGLVCPVRVVVPGMNVLIVEDEALVDLRLGHGRCGATVDAYLHETFGTTALYVTANRDFAYRYRTCAIGFAEKPLSSDSQFAVVRFLTAWHDGRRPPVPAGVTLFGDREVEAGAVERAVV